MGCNWATSTFLLRKEGNHGWPENAGQTERHPQWCALNSSHDLATVWNPNAAGSGKTPDSRRLIIKEIKHRGELGDRQQLFYFFGQIKQLELPTLVGNRGVRTD